MGSFHLSRGQELSLTAGIEFLNEFACERTILDFSQNLLHFFSCIFCDQSLACSVVTVFSSVGDGVSHLVETAFVDQVYDQLHFRREQPVHQRGLFLFLL